MSAGAVMERMRRRLCINLGKNAELKKEEDRKQTQFSILDVMQFHACIQIKSGHPHHFSTLRCAAHVKVLKMVMHASALRS